MRSGKFCRPVTSWWAHCQTWHLDYRHNSKKVYNSDRFQEHQEDQKIWVKEQSFSLVFVQLELLVDGSLLYIAHSFACCRKENQCWNEELSCTTQCHQQTCDVEQSDVQWYQIEAVFTGWKGLGRVLSPEERRTTKRTAPIHDPEQKRSASFHSDMTQRTQEQCHEYQKHLSNGSAASRDLSY